MALHKINGGQRELMFNVYKLAVSTRKINDEPDPENESIISSM